MSPVQYPPTLAGDFADLDRAQAVQGPAQYLFTAEDVIQIDSLASVAGLVVTISGAMLSQRLQLIPFSFTVVPNSNRTIATTRAPVDGGWLEHIRVSVTTGTPLLGQCFVFVRIARGVTANALVLGTIASGYVTANTDLYWPGGTTQLPLDGEGAALRIGVTTPAAGSDFSVTVPTGARWELVSVSGQLAAAVAVANRNTELVIDDGANIIFAAPSQTSITSGQTARVSWGAGAGGPLAGLNLDQTMPIPNDLYTPGGFRIRSNTQNLQGADAWTAISLYVREWLEGN